MIMNKPRLQYVLYAYMDAVATVALIGGMLTHIVSVLIFM